LTPWQQSETFRHFFNTLLAESLYYIAYTPYRS
jgi:hypothetical protein